MKNPLNTLRYSLAICILLISALQSNAQYVPAYDKDSKVRSSADKAAEEARNKANINSNKAVKAAADAEESPRQREQRLDAARAENQRKIEASYGKYNYIGLEFAGLRPARLGVKWGYLDGSDKEVIPIVYDELKFMDNGLYGVRLNKLWGFVDRTGKVVVPVIYSSLLNGFSSYGVAGVTKGYGEKINIDKYGPVTDAQITRLKNGGYDTRNNYYEDLAAVAFTGGKKGYVDKSNKLVLPMIYDDANNFSEGVASVKFGNKWGFINKTGMLVIPAKYDIAGTFQNGMAIVSFNGKYGYIDSKDNVIVPLKYDKIFTFKDGLALVSLNGKYGYVDNKGNVSIPLIYDDYRQEVVGIYALKLGSKWGFVDKTGATLLAFQYDDVINNFFVPSNADLYANDFNPPARAPMAVVVQNFEQFTITTTGEGGIYKKDIVPTGFEEAGEFHNGLAAVKVKGKWGMINKKNVLIIPAIYDIQLYAFNPVFLVRLNSKYGYADTTGKVITACKYDYAADFNNGPMPIVRVNNKWGAIDNTGAEVIPLQYDEMNTYSRTQTFSVKLNNKWGLIDKSGAVLLEIKYDEKCDITDMFISQVDYPYFIGKYGNEIVPYIYKTVLEPQSGLIYFKSEGKYYPFDYNGKKLTKKMIKTE